MHVQHTKSVGLQLYVCGSKTQLQRTAVRRWLGSGRDGAREPLPLVRQIFVAKGSFVQLG